MTRCRSARWTPGLIGWRDGAKEAAFVAHRSRDWGGTLWTSRPAVSTVCTPEQGSRFFCRPRIYALPLSLRILFLHFPSLRQLSGLDPTPHPGTRGDCAFAQIPPSGLHPTPAAVCLPSTISTDSPTSPLIFALPQDVYPHPPHPLSLSRQRRALGRWPLPPRGRLRRARSPPRSPARYQAEHRAPRRHAPRIRRPPLQAAAPGARSKVQVLLHEQRRDQPHRYGGG